MCYRLKARCSNDRRAQVWQAGPHNGCTASERQRGVVKHFYLAAPISVTPPGSSESVSLCRHLKSMPDYLVAPSE